MARNELNRVTWFRNMTRHINTAQRPENVQALRKRIAQGEGRTEKLNYSDGRPFFIYGLTPMTDDYYI
jgi:hypothetical protein